ncbi:MAG TPA: N-formylglutamate deformylase [Steroidobacteraceae bacterium]|nr:N-formylglutamate deformylase [Steroidobacteraceae bacterium]HRX87820.1 N-formylglutamate deformylase [Steroidobacteraceae bacterium]
MSASPQWLTVVRGEAPLLVSVPHAGTEIPANLEAQFVSPWLARKDTDWYVRELYEFAASLGATIVSTAISRSVIDVNRDPSGASLYPGQATTELCPRTTFDGEPLYRDPATLTAGDVGLRREYYFRPYHAALGAELDRLRRQYSSVVLYDAHSIRSRVARLFAGELPVLNIGSFGGRSCAAPLGSAIEQVCAASVFTHVVNGRFQGGYITRHYGDPARGIHALQMELACRGYLREPDGPLTSDNWPPAYDPAVAQPLQEVLRAVLLACIDCAQTERGV